jgi:hypothetical protein
MSFDPKCYELAEYFVSDTEICRGETVNELAQLIQDTIEDFLTADEDEPDYRGADRDEWKHEAVQAQRLK